MFEDKWTHPPFGADIDSEGRIFARGSQDMKCVGVQYLAAIRALKKNGVTLKRTIHVMFVPGNKNIVVPENRWPICIFTDEEIGGIPGMKAFVHTDEFKALNVGFALDEGLASATDEYPVYYAERSIWSNNLMVNVFSKLSLFR